MSTAPLANHDDRPLTARGSEIVAEVARLSAEYDEALLLCCEQGDRLTALDEALREQETEIVDLESENDKLRAMLKAERSKREALTSQLHLINFETEGPYMGSTSQLGAAGYYEYLTNQSQYRHLTKTEAYEHIGRMKTSRDSIQKAGVLYDLAPDVFTAMRYGWFTTMREATLVARRDRNTRPSILSTLKALRAGIDTDA
jgi:hypothetical protein